MKNCCKKNVKTLHDELHYKCAPIQYHVVKYLLNLIATRFRGC